MGKKIIFFFVLVTFVFTGTSYAAENPFQGLTQDKVIQKYFEGRQLDMIEGIWLDRDAKPLVIINTSLVDAKKQYNNDYLEVEFSSSSNVEIVGISKTQYPSCFERGKYKRVLRFLSQTTLHFGWIDSGGTRDYFYTRIYPSEFK